MSAQRRLRRGLLAAGGLVALASAATLAAAARRIEAEQASFRAPAAPSCAPATLNRSAVLPGTSLVVSPLPGSRAASPRAQISLLGAPGGAIRGLRVRGSRSGPHSGSLRGYSQGDGASFIPAKPFTPGESVTVHGRLRAGAPSPRTQPFAFSFVVAHADQLPYTAPTLPSGRDPNEVQHFHTRPDLRPPVLAVTADSPQTAPGDLFITPYNGPGPAGPAIFDSAGNLVWFDPVPPAVAAANLQMQLYDGQPVLTWWQGYVPREGFGEGEDVIANSSYRQIGRVHAGNGYKADLHDFHISPQDTALITAFNPIACNLSAVGGPSGGAVTDTLFQEIDLRTELVRREWHSVDHAPLADSYSSAVTTSASWPFDYFHLNSVEQQADGTTLISARNTSAVYELDTETGQVLRQIGGKRSSVTLGPGTHTAFQHDAVAQPGGTISLFDNGATPKVHSQSRALLEAVDPGAGTASLVAQYEHPTPLSSNSQGSVQLLPGGDVFVGWGSEPYASEFTASGQLLFDAHLHGSYESYRVYRLPWSGTPAERPAIAAASAGAGAGGGLTVYASWNGDTRAASWLVFAGPSPRQLQPVASAPRTGFETAIRTPGPAAYVAVQALDPSGALLGVSRTIRG